MTPRPGKSEPEGEALLQQASDPTTPAEVLAHLAKTHRDTLGRELAANPNTPQDVLHRLWMVHPLMILENPILAYQALSTGDELHALLPLNVKLVLYDVLRREDRNEELDSLLPPHDREAWLSNHHEKSAFSELSSEFQESLILHLSSDSSARVRRTFLNRLPNEHLHLFASDPEVSIRRALASKLPSYHYHKSNLDGTWDAVVDRLCLDPAEDVREALAACICLTPLAHETLSRDQSPDVREALAEKGKGKNLSETGWRELVSGGPELCRLVAGNSCCPETVLLELTDHPDQKVRTKAWAGFDFQITKLGDRLTGKLDCLFSNPLRQAEKLVLAGSRSLTHAIIQQLIQCDPSVTRVLASNMKLSDSDKEELWQQSDPETVANLVIHDRSKTFIQKGFQHPSPKVRAAIAGMTGQLAVRLRLELAVDPVREVREAARHYVMDHVGSSDGPNLRETLRILSHDPSSKIRAAVIRDRRLAPAEFERLCGDPSERVRLELLKLQQLSAKSHFGLLDHKRALVRWLAADLIMGFDEGRIGIMAKSRMQFERQIASDSSAAVRAVAAESPYTSVKVLHRLIGDPAPEVQKALLKRDFPQTRWDFEKWMGGPKRRGLKRLEASRNSYCRAVAASYNGAGKIRKARMASDSCWFVRAMLAKNGHQLKESILISLTHDTHPEVRKIAADRIAEERAEALYLTEGGRR